MDPHQALQNAFNFHQRGQLDQARSLYRQLINANPKNHRALHLLGVLENQQGNRSEAIALIARSVEVEPRDFAAQMNYGLVLASAGKHDEALRAYGRALALKSDFFEAHYNKGVALATLRRFEEAVVSFDQAIILQPQNAACFYNKALALASAKRLVEAVLSYEKALAHEPGLAPAWENRGNALHALGRDEEALESYDRALSIERQSSALHYNKATALAALKRYEEAVVSYDTALQTSRNFVDAWINRGNALLGLQRFSDAAESFDAALAIRGDDLTALTGKLAALRGAGQVQKLLDICDQVLMRHPDWIPGLTAKAMALHDATQFPAAVSVFKELLGLDQDNAEGWNGCGAALYAMKHEEEALRCFERAVRLKPEFPDALNNHAHLVWTCEGNYATALAGLKKSISLDPDQPYVLGALLHLKMQGADWTDFEHEVARVNAGIRAGKPTARPFVYQALSRSPADVQKCSRLYSAREFPAESTLSIFKKTEKIRLGYLSGEFKEQATAYLMAGLYEHHDREKFEVIAIDNTGPNASPMRRRLESAFEKFIDISQLSDDAASDLVRAEKIDILVNLNGYFGSARMGLFARRSAPIQVNYLGFPATLGADYIDYIIADRVVIPDNERRFFDEQVVWLPHCYQANDNRRFIAQAVPSRVSLGLPEDAFVFCNFNQSYKITPDVFAIWMRILDRTAGSVLWLLESKSPFAENLRRVALEHGVSGDRLVFARPLVAEEHLSRLKCADLFLDTLPYNAHTTASDSLWAGVPVLTCRGTTFPGRVAASMLNTMGLGELVTETMEEYENTAIQLANNRNKLMALRDRLETQRLKSPLFDTGLFRKYIEAAYIRMWTNWVSGQSAAGFAVPLDLNQPASYWST
jgi:protein O-GlcNAc transferase